MNMKGTAAKTYLAHGGSAMEERGARRRVLTGAVAALLALVAAVLLIAAAPAIGLTGTLAHGEAADWEGERGPEFPAIDDEFAVDDPKPATVPAITVTLRDPVTGVSKQIQTTTGSIALPTYQECGMTPPEGAQFVGWSTDSNGKKNVYAAGQMFPDNASHTAMLTQDTVVYAIWLMPGDYGSTVTAYYYIRLDGVIPFEPDSHANSGYAPAGSATILRGTLNRPTAVTNNLAVVQANLRRQPQDAAIQTALTGTGVSYDPNTQKVVWYVIKAREAGGNNMFNVDGVIVSKTANLVIYDSNGGDSNVPPAVAYQQGQTVTVNTDTRPTRWGYQFMGWSEDPAATSPTYGSATGGSFAMPGKTVTLYAVWRPSVVPVKYVAEPQNLGRVSVASNSVTALTAEGLTGSVAKANGANLFEGWYQGSTLVTTDVNLTEALARDNLLTERSVVLPTTFVARFAEAAPSLTLEKAIANAPANGEYFTPGEIITFSLKVINSGNVALKNVTIDDSLRTLEPIGALGVAEERDITYNYEVTDADVEAGFVRNVAVASGVCTSQATKSVKSEPASVAAAVQAAPANSTYVVYGAYPSAGGSVDIPYEVMDAVTAEGLRTVTATPMEGYEFQGWYRHDGELICNDEALDADLIKDSLVSDAQRSPYAPTLFLAYFTPQSEEPDEPDNPDNPANPDDPANPDNPGDGTEGGDDANGGEADDGTGSDVADNDSAAATEKPTYHTMNKTSGSASSSSMPRTADDLGTAIWTMIGLMAAAGALAFVARHFRDCSE